MKSNLAKIYLLLLISTECHSAASNNRTEHDYNQEFTKEEQQSSTNLTVIVVASVGGCVVVVIIVAVCVLRKKRNSNVPCISSLHISICHDIILCSTDNSQTNNHELPAKKGNAKVVYPCKPKNDDELKVEVGQVSDVLKQKNENIHANDHTYRNIQKKEKILAIEWKK